MLCSKELSWILFQSTPSVRRETREDGIADAKRFLFQSTPSVRRETQVRDPARHIYLISIHSLRAEGDIS